MSQQVPAQERNHLLSKKRPLESSDSEESSRKRPALLDLLEVGVVVHVEVEEEKKEEAAGHGHSHGPGGHSH